MEGAKDVHVPAENLNKKKEAEKIKEKLQIQREKRQLVDKFRNARALADSDEEEDAADWLKRQKRKDEEKASPRKRPRKDDNAELNSVESKRRREAMYSSKDLKGLAIGHKVDSFKDGHNTILTLRDKGVLDEDEDVLENVNLLDNEKAAKNVENKGKKTGYKPYDDDEFDEFGILKRSSLLSKYDEELDGPKKDVFRIGETASSADLARLKLQQEELQGKISLSLPEFKVASEYYTADEMVKFKKTKRKGAMRKRNLKSERKDEPMQIVADSSKSTDHGSRSKHRSKSEASKGSLEDNGKVCVNLKELEDNDDFDIDLMGPDEDLTGIKIEEDEAEKELFSALSKTRKLKLKENNDTAQFNIARIVQEGKKEREDNESSSICENGGNTLVLSTTSEFCRNLGNLPRHDSFNVHKMAKVADDSGGEEKMPLEDDVMAVDLEDDDGEMYRNNWNEVDIKMEDEEVAEEMKSPSRYHDESADEYESKPILEEEPDVSVGVAGALKLAMNKGYLDKESKKQAGTNPASASDISAQAYTIEEKF